jgi:general L-amino acid transport system permease protein
MTGIALDVKRAAMVRGRANAIASIVLGAVLAGGAVALFRWAILDAVWTLPLGASSAACRAAQGACWAVIAERFRFMLFGTYPYAQQWRPAIVCVLFLALYGASAVRAWWKPWLLGCWIAVPTLSIAIMRGGAPSDAWGGLPLTFLLSTIGFAVAFPLGILLALGRRSTMPAIRWLSTAYIELIRGIPLVSMLFMAALMFPLFMPPTITIDKVLRAQVAIVMAIAAYVAEVVRGGLQGVPRGQFEAAASMGLSYWRTMVLVVLPQALRATVPALVNTFIAFFKDTSLVTVIGLFDLLGAAKAVIVDPKWVGFGVEVYVFVAAIYFAFCYAVSAFTRRLELRAS